MSERWIEQAVEDMTKRWGNRRDLEAEVDRLRELLVSIRECVTVCDAVNEGAKDRAHHDDLLARIDAELGI